MRTDAHGNLLQLFLGTVAKAFCQEHGQGHYFRLCVELEPLCARIEHYLLRRPDVFTSDVKAFARYRISERALDLNGPALPCAELDNEINLCSCRGAVKGSAGCRWQRIKDVLYKHSLPARADNRMPQQLFLIADTEQGVQQSGIPYIDLGCTNQPLLRVRSPRLQATNKQQVHHDVEVACDHMSAYAEPAGKLRRIKHLPLVVREHLPVAPERLRWDTRPERGDIAFKVGLDEGRTPCEAVLVIGGKE